MKRNIYPSTASAIAWWENNTNALKADLFVISLPTGQTIHATEGQWDLAIAPGMLPPGLFEDDSVALSVPGTTQAWMYTGGVNGSFGGYPTSGEPNGTDPIIVSLPGHIHAGSTIRVTATGLISWSRFSSTPTIPPDGLGSGTASAPGTNVTPSTTSGGSLIGAFTDASGVIVPGGAVYVGSGATLTVPAGAVQLQLGINDGIPNDNNGAFSVTVDFGLPPLLFRAMTNGLWSRGKITSEASFRCQANNVALTVIPKIGSTYPGLSISILNAAVNHLFDGAHVWIFTAYMPFGEYGNIQVVETKWQGWILRGTPGRLQCQFECGDPFFLLNQKVPSRLFQSACYKSFADANCGLNAANYTVNFTAASGSAQYLLTPSSAFTQPDGYFTQGIVKCLTGANAGLAQTVKVHLDGSITMVAPWLLPVSPGDTFSVEKGCDQTPTTCASMTHTDGTLEPGNWQVRFGGMPFMPPPSTGIG